jgi:TBC1 domain family member 2
VDCESLGVPQGFDDKVSEVNLQKVEADAYWCLSKLLDVILDNYTNSWPGIFKSFSKVEEIFKRVDPELLEHFTQENIDFYHLYFKWVTCLLLRQFSTKTGLRLFDTYLADETNYFNLCLYILAAMVLKYSKKFKKMSFEEMMVFQQNMPTKEWM